jgi:opacity protein-like surface antigen
VKTKQQMNNELFIEDQFDGNDLGLAFHAGAGFRWAFTEAMALDVSYRFRGIAQCRI